MSQLSCPRCGEAWQALEPCPSCGYAPEHPGILGAYRQALGTLADRPGLLVGFALPVGLLLVGQVALVGLEPGLEVGYPLVALASLAVLFLHTWWFYLVLAGTTAALHREDPAGQVALSSLAPSALAAGLAWLPWLVVTGLLLWSPQGALGAVAQLATFILLIVALWVMGRAVGVPVVAGLGTGDPRQAVEQGNRRGRERGGLGVVVLFVCMLGLLLVVSATLVVAGVVQAPLWARRTGFAVALWLLEAWAGVAAVHALAQGQGAARTFTCPRCGETAEAQGGRAACACGLEGPFYPGGRGQPADSSR